MKDYGYIFERQPSLYISFLSSYQWLMKGFNAQIEENSRWDIKTSPDYIKSYLDFAYDSGMRFVLGEKCRVKDIKNSPDYIPYLELKQLVDGLRSKYPELFRSR